MRIERELTQEEVGKILGVTKAAVQKYESGQIRNFRADTIRKLSDLFEVPPVYFVYDELPEYAKVEGREALLIYFGKRFVKFLENMDKLNETGKKKMYEYCDDLVTTNKYRKRRDA